MRDVALDTELRGMMLDQNDPVLRGMMQSAKNLGAKPHIIVQDLPGAGKVAFLTTIVTAMSDQVYNAFIGVMRTYIIPEITASVMAELERRGVIPPAALFTEAAPPQEGEQPATEKA